MFEDFKELKRFEKGCVIAGVISLVLVLFGVVLYASTPEAQQCEPVVLCELPIVAPTLSNGYEMVEPSIGKRGPNGFYSVTGPGFGKLIAPAKIVEFSGERFLVPQISFDKPENYTDLPDRVQGGR